MKKTLVTALTTALVVGAASTTFAAANPFTDVPADHWAYDAVAQLAKDGVITGYGDGTYKGQKQITRYEMAVMVARAMANNNGVNVSGNDKALLDKLAAEFGDELNNLGVRVSNLEKNADKVKWNGEARYTYTSNRNEAIDGTKTKKNNDELLLRLEPTAEINSNWHVKARLDSSADLSKDTSTEVKLKRIWAQGDYKNFQVKLGKFGVATNYDNSLMLNDQASGAAVTVGNKLKATVFAGRIDLAGDSTLDTALGALANNDAAANLQSVALSYKAGNLAGTAAYYNATSDEFKTAGYAKSGKEDTFGAWEVAGSYKFGKDVALGGAYIKNEKADYYNKAGMVQLDYKGAQKANKGTWGAYVAYRHIGKYAVIDANQDDAQLNSKGWAIGGNYTLFKNTVANVKYFNGEDLNTKKDVSKLFGRVEFFF
ncbi:MAG: putative porin [Selenomonas sp.]|uniref:putative porin n=1 Tax=Selenomonas sp. TaxID=2053611 RepID=UPI0025F69147|nr:putative porin [Selenomonas sp.]MCR5439448.1 putative porin [Selenomonas sp.]